MPVIMMPVIIMLCGHKWQEHTYLRWRLFAVDMLGALARLALRLSEGAPRSAASICTKGETEASLGNAETGRGGLTIWDQPSFRAHVCVRVCVCVMQSQKQGSAKLVIVDWCFEQQSALSSCACRHACP